MPILDPIAVRWSGLPPLDPEGKDNSADPSPSIVNFDETYRPRPLACKQCGWIIGVVMKKWIGKMHTRRLWVFTEAYCDVSAMPSVSVLRSSQRNLYRVRGLDHCDDDGDGIECSHCGEINPWSMSLESYLRMVSHYQEALPLDKTQSPSD